MGAIQITHVEVANGRKLELIEIDLDLPSIEHMEEYRTYLKKVHKAKYIYFRYKTI